MVRGERGKREKQAKRRKGEMGKRVRAASRGSAREIKKRSEDGVGSREIMNCKLQTSNCKVQIERT